MYELSNHLGNVLTTVSDIKLTADANADGVVDSYAAVITSAQDYYPFGSLEPGRTYSSDNYRFGFNGQEMDNEISGQTGTHTTAMFWEYDARLGRRWNRDPISYSWQSRYACFNNNPVIYRDPLGLEGTVGGDDPPKDPKSGQIWGRVDRRNKVVWVYKYDKKKGWVGKGGYKQMPKTDIEAKKIPSPKTPSPNNNNKGSWFSYVVERIGNFLSDPFGNDTYTRSYGTEYYSKDGGNDNNAMANPEKTNTEIDHVEASQLLAAVCGVASTKGPVPKTFLQCWNYTVSSFKNGQDWEEICQEIEKMLKPEVTVVEKQSTKGIPVFTGDSMDIEQPNGSFSRFGTPQVKGGYLYPSYRNVTSEEHGKHPFPSNAPGPISIKK